MAQASSENTTTLLVTRQMIEAQIDLLIDALDQYDPDPDAEPSLGFTEDFYNPTQVGPNFTANANAGDDREEEDEREPSEDGEPSLGWTDNEKQGCAAWLGQSPRGDDLEEGVGPVRKKRSRSKTGGYVFRGVGVLDGDGPPDPRECNKVRMPMARPRGRASR